MASYLYNGIELPALPEWDKTTYPYVYLSLQGTSMGYLYMFQEPKHLIYDNFGAMCTYIVEGESYLQSSSFNGNDFKPVKEITATFNQPLHSVINWANYDILNADGTIYLAASEPILAGPHFDLINPLYFLLGWQTGRRIALLRAERRPIAYNYGSVTLPTVHYWNKEKYPYAILTKVISGWEDTDYIFVCFQNRPYYAEEEIEGKTRRKILFGDKAPVYFRFSKEKWHEETQSDWTQIVLSYDSTIYHEMIWSKSDILAQDGTVWFESFEPGAIYR